MVHVCRIPPEERERVALKIVADLAAKDPTAGDGAWTYCVICGEYLDYRDGERPHLPTCPWLRAKALLEGK